MKRASKESGTYQGLDKVQKLRNKEKYIDPGRIDSEARIRAMKGKVNNFFTEL